MCRPVEADFRCSRSSGPCSVHTIADNLLSSDVRALDDRSSWTARDGLASRIVLTQVLSSVGQKRAYLVVNNTVLYPTDHILFHTVQSNEHYTTIVPFRNHGDYSSFQLLGIKDDAGNYDDKD